MILGVGTDVVDVDAFAHQLDEPGSRFSRVFTGRERRTAQARAAEHAQPGGQPEVAAHLAARWAAKESFIKAWSAALYGRPPVISETDMTWADIEVSQDRWGRPSLSLHGEMARAVEESVGPVRCHVSLTHDGPVASAIIVLESVA
ncbi:holo-ACP synthase [Actinomycetaceae bacterium L2_0104]